MVKMEYWKKKAAFEKIYLIQSKTKWMYQKPANTGKKSSRDASSKWRCVEPEPELFVDRIADKGTVTPTKLVKPKNVENDWEITNSNETFEHFIHWTQKEVKVNLLC